MLEQQLLVRCHRRGPGADRLFGLGAERCRAEAEDEDDEPFADKMARLVTELRAQQEDAARLDSAIAANLRELGYGG